MVRLVRRRAKRAIKVSQRARHFARLAQILRCAKNACSRMTNKLRHYQLVRELEVHSDLGLNFDGLAVEEVGFIFPLFDGIGGGFGKQCVSAKNLHGGDVSRLGDGRQELDLSFNVQLESGRRILRLNFLDDEALRDALGDIHRLQHGRGDVGIRADEIAQGRSGVRRCHADHAGSLGV